MISAAAENLLKVIMDDVDRYLRDDSIIDGREYFESVYEALQDLEDELIGSQIQSRLDEMLEIVNGMNARLDA